MGSESKDDVLLRQYAVRRLGENWPVVLMVAEAIRSKGVAMPRVDDPQLVMEFCNENIPAGKMERAKAHGQAILDEWQRAAGEPTQAEIAAQAQKRLAQALSGGNDPMTTPGQMVMGTPEQQAQQQLIQEQMQYQQAQQQLEAAKDQREAAAAQKAVSKAQAAVAKAQQKLEQIQGGKQANQLAAVVVALGKENTPAGVYEQVVSGALEAVK